MLNVQVQVQTYKKKLTLDLEHHLSEADIELHRGLNDLVNAFNEKCHVIHDAGQVFRDHIANETLEVDNEKIVFNEHMETFRTLYQQKEAKLRGLWKQYVDVQKQIMELALVVLEEDDVQIAAPELDEYGNIKEGQGKAKDPELDEDAVVERKGECEQGYIDSLHVLDDFQQKLNNLTSEALKKNKEVFKAGDPVKYTMNLLTRFLGVRSRTETYEGHNC